tara:strand:+ start:172 stop:570 length:399 start_codon:yes stop_codon:yes gene_type:complete
MASSNTASSVVSTSPVQKNPTQESPVPADTVFTVVIPWAETWVDQARIMTEFDELDFGTINKVDIVHRTQGKRPHQKIFIHFSDFNEEYMAHLESGKEIKVFYNGSYFWKVRKSNYSHSERNSAPKNKIELC